jgi:hypothetical protein
MMVFHQENFPTVHFFKFLSSQILIRSGSGSGFSNSLDPDQGSAKYLDPDFSESGPETLPSS